MAWPKTGTVSVTNGSAVVTGTGTSFFGSAQAGWGFVGPDGRVYEVLTADSPTQITLASNYQGATAAGQVYSLFPTMSLAHDLVASVQALISNYQAIADGPGAGLFPGLISYQADQDTGVSNPSANEIGLDAGGALQLALKAGFARGAAVQSSATDNTAGKLLTADAFGIAKSSPIPNGNVDNAVVGGTYHGYGGLHAAATLGDNPFPTLNGAFALEVAKTRIGSNTEYLLQRVTSLGGIGGLSKKAKWRIKNTDANGWEAWIEAITSGGGQTINGPLTCGDFTVQDNNPVLDLYDQDATAIFARTRFLREGTLFRMATRDSSGAAVTNDYEATVGATGVTEHGWNIGGSRAVTINSSSKVGVLTSDPQVELDVRGQITAGGTPVGSTAKISSRNDDAADGAYSSHSSHASYTGSAVSLNAVRAASSAYKFLQAFSGNFADLETKIGGDGNNTCDGSWTGGGADDAEYFEWLDGNASGEIRTGYSVVLVGNRIRPALEGEQPIGVISANPSVVGDGDIDRWKEKYLRDDFSAYLWEEYEVLSWTETVTEITTETAPATEA